MLREMVIHKPMEEKEFFNMVKRHVLFHVAKSGDGWEVREIEVKHGRWSDVSSIGLKLTKRFIRREDAVLYVSKKQFFSEV